MSRMESMPLSDQTPRAPAAVRLMREVRFSIDRDWASAAHGLDGFERAHPISNSWGGWPSGVGIAPYLTLRIVASGAPDPVSGYLVNIQQLDALLREHAIPIAARQLREVGVRLTGEGLVSAVGRAVSARMPEGCQFESLSLGTTPTLCYSHHAGEGSMVELSQCFEFSASHRLHVAAWDDARNRAVFGKCNNPNGHGHNYQVEVTVAGEVDGDTGTVLPLPTFEAIVKQHVIDRLDHTHLNADVAAFANLNPSVENIAHVVWEWLVDAVAPATLRRVRVWETAKTFAEYSD